MTSKPSGIDSSKKRKLRKLWLKLAAALIVSNIFFFFLFHSPETTKKSLAIPDGWVQLQVKAELLTPFHYGKKVLLLNRQSNRSVEAMLETAPTDVEGRFTVLVKESSAAELIRLESWEILPFLKTLTFAPKARGEQHEIRY
jgi:hypothetical protein